MVACTPTSIARSRHLLASLLALALALLAAPTAHAAGSGFGVSPLKYDVDIKPGSSRSFTVRIENHDPGSTRFTFGREDVEGDKSEPTATPVLLGGKLPSSISAHDWLTPPPPLVVPAGESRTVQVRVAAPADATGGHYAALIVNGATSTAAGITARSRIAVVFMFNAGGVPPPDIVITEVRETGPTRTVTKIRYVNEGQVATQPRPVVTIKDPVTGKPIRKVTGTCSTALPGGSGECVVDEAAPVEGTTVGDRSDGGTRREVGSSGEGFTSGATQKSVDLVGDDAGSSARAELPAEWAGAWSSLLLPLVGITLFVLYFLFLRRRRKEEKELDEDLLASGSY